MPFLSRGLAIALGAMMLLSWPSLTADAAETATSELVIIREADTMLDDLYAGGIRVIVDGTIDGDLVAFAAEDVVINGRVTGDVIAVAPTITVGGEVEGALRVSGGSVEVSGSVGGDVVAVVFGADLSESSLVSGDVVAWALDMTCAGMIGGDLEGTYRRLDLSGEVDGDVEVTVKRLTVSNDLEVAGDLGYRSEDEATGLEVASVDGAVVHKTPLPPNIRVRALGLLARILVAMALTAVALLVVWSWPRRTERAAERLRVDYGKAFGLGMAVVASPLILAAIIGAMFVLIPASTAVPLLAILLPLTAALAGAVLAVSVIAGVPAILTLGRLLPGEFGPHGSVLYGSAVVATLWLLPVVGWLVSLVVISGGLGAWTLTGFSSGEPALDQTA